MTTAPPNGMRKRTIDLAAQLRALAEQPQRTTRAPRIRVLGFKFIGASSWPAFTDREDTVPDVR